MLTNAYLIPPPPLNHSNLRLRTFFSELAVENTNSYYSLLLIYGTLHNKLVIMKLLYCPTYSHEFAISRTIIPSADDN